MGSNGQQVLSSMEIDAIGEILNISMGSSATSVSELLSQKVNITTPMVQVERAGNFQLKAMEPAVGVEITYVSGLSGRNVMILKESDVKVIVGLLLQTDYSDSEFVLDEMSLGAICEVMNLMMGASATALSQLLNRMVNISPPNSFEVNNSEQFKYKYFDSDEIIVAIHFNLMIGDLVNSEFISLMTVELAKELISTFNIDSSDESGTVEEARTPSAAQESPEPAPVSATAPEYADLPPDDRVPDLQSPSKPEAQRNYVVQHAVFKSFDSDETVPEPGKNDNLDMIMAVPLQITVEIGRASKKIKEILSFAPGTIIELDKQTDSQVDIIVNGQPTFKGDVVVVNDSYGVRITEITGTR
ncbi:MAG: flagellar motor switch phosphatase FliY [Clostridia bacterium]|nr:flagellar motor switch phosphatase FliY [Clostridia bacterium]